MCFIFTMEFIFIFLLTLQKYSDNISKIISKTTFNSMKHILYTLNNIIRQYKSRISKI